MSQLSLPFLSETPENLFREEDFLLLSENSAAVTFCKKFFAQESFGLAHRHSLILKGPSSCGKTHLLHIFTQKFKAEFLDKEKISTMNLANAFKPNQFYILEDINQIKDEELILHSINAAFEAQAFLVLSSQDIFQFQLKDLTSRLKNISCIEITEPSLESIKLLLANGISRRQIKLSRQVIDFISNNIERSYEAIFAVMKLLESRVQESSKSISLFEVKMLLSSLPQNR